MPLDVRADLRLETGDSVVVLPLLVRGKLVGVLVVCAAASVTAGATSSLLAVGVLAQLGMSSQLAAFGICTALGRPLVYVWIVLAQLAAVTGILLLTPSNQEVFLEHH